MTSARLVMSYEAHGATPAAVVADAHRIAQEAVGEGVDVHVEVGTITPHLTATDGSGHTNITRWHADCSATADVEMPNETGATR